MSRSCGVLGILGPFAFSANLFCSPFSGRDTLKNRRVHGESVNTTHSCVWHDSFVRGRDVSCVGMTHACVQCGMHMRGMTHLYAQETCWVKTCLISMRHVTDAYAWHDSFIRVKYLSSVDMTHPYVWQDSCTCATQAFYMCDRTRVECECMHEYKCVCTHVCVYACTREC